MPQTIQICVRDDKEELFVLGTVRVEHPNDWDWQAEWDEWQREIVPDHVRVSCIPIPAFPSEPNNSEFIKWLCEEYDEVEQVDDVTMVIVEA